MTGHGVQPHPAIVLAINFHLKRLSDFDFCVPTIPICATVQCYVFFFVFSDAVDTTYPQMKTMSTKMRNKIMKIWSKMMMMKNSN